MAAEPAASLVAAVREEMRAVYGGLFLDGPDMPTAGRDVPSATMDAGSSVTPIVATGWMTVIDTVRTGELPPASAARRSTNPGRRGSPTNLWRR
jgi:hypothetical protein